MSFERIFESRGNRLTMVGLFLAILELIREQLVWAEQPKGADQIHLRSLTDEPAQEAVRKAMLAAEAASGANQTPASPVELEAQPSPQPPIPIVELPAQGEAKQPAENLEPLGGQTGE